MSMSDPIADMLTRIRNAGRVNHPDVTMPSSKLKLAIANVLKEEGYITDYALDDDAAVKKVLRITLKYMDGVSVIEGVERASKPSLRIYTGATEVPRVLGGLGIAILSTPKGVISGKKAKAGNVGGEVICHVW